jgi:RHS repeat-associated protein
VVLKLLSSFIKFFSNDRDSSKYLHGDHLGSRRLKTNSTGGSIYSSNYQPYGVGQGESGSEEFRYTGKPEDDASGLYYYGARYYDPSIARFITGDTNPGTLNDSHPE